MKKTLILAAAVIVLAGLIIGVGTGTAVTIFSSPEYALKQIEKDVSENGIDALEFYLTGDALSVWDTVSSVTDSSLLNSLLSILDTENTFGMLKSEFNEIQWTFDRIENKRKDSADVFLDFNYDDRFTGELEFRMTKTDGQWLISDLEFPVFEKTEW